ncbi:hypothetical protein PTE01_25160 [Pseudoalteromonas tetraodonis GFC]|uniref:Orphan protein n=1 Tax=Pseudoalteromonas tetraodonis GFC TaxID=1315271 RepID=A0AA37S0B2_9GAMM|nr:hypothetical protein [Pseudoalteromonas tetraodonis]ATD03622.1 hypothetical protein PTET_a2272 [Pseudoalteromonas tetraodonis]GEN39406.1 hypothetical protein PTE01_25160 [Pseudoalteromonas tetraodonis GFC]GLQ01396.1 hypothetical protein GCM10007914_02770 [Pseudoalteromonas tetraodonis GFC]
MKISTASIQYQASNYNNQPLIESEQQRINDKSEEEPDYVLSEFLDAKVQKYSEDNSTFAEQYQNLEKAYKYFTQQVVALQEQVNKLKQSTVQRSLTIDNSQYGPAEDDSRLTMDAEHMGAKKYKTEQQQEEINRLELQLSEVKSQQAAIKQQIIELVINEMKRRGDDFTI